jgi:hypothetical protein
MILSETGANKENCLQEKLVKATKQTGANHLPSAAKPGVIGDGGDPIYLKIEKISYKKKLWRPPRRKEKRGKNLSPRNRIKACHTICTALLINVAEIGTHSRVP